jgi:type II secretion system protein G
MFRRIKGFTLIELLIVVAIIAILAAIAVPNFLEAQTRAKVSRAKADIRTLVIGFEAYHVDNNTYPDDNLKYAVEFCQELTTPVAYLSTNQYTDPFHSQNVSALYKKSYLYGVYMPGSFRSVYYSDPGGHNLNYKRHVVVVTSEGPDQNDSSSLAYPIAVEFVGHPFTFAPSSKLNPPFYTDMIYDPSNGTVSGGDVFRVTGEAKGTQTPG